MLRFPIREGGRGARGLRLLGAGVRRGRDWKETFEGKYTPIACIQRHSAYCRLDGFLLSPIFSETLITNPCSIGFHEETKGRGKISESRLTWS